MNLAANLATLRTGFDRTFWVANVIELFERFAYYGSKAILTVYVAEQVGLGPGAAAWLVGSVFNTLLFFLPILAGTVVDRYGFKKSLQLCFAVFSAGYLLIGLGGLPAGRGLVGALGARTYMLLALSVTAAGGSLVKPSIVGTVARTADPAAKSLGYSIYYMLVNLGGAIGPILALQVRQRAGIAYVLVMSSLTSLALLAATTAFFREPPPPADAPPPRRLRRVVADMALVFTNGRFVAFLVIFSGFWVMFWQLFYSFPFYVRDVLRYERFELMETVDAWTVILVTVPATALARRLPPMRAMALGVGLASVGWFALGLGPKTVPAAVAAVALFAFGEATQAPRFYEYVADLAPKEQVGTYMGFAFLPVAIGTFVAGAVAGPLVKHYVGTTAGGAFTPGPGAAEPGRMWLLVGAVGVVTTLLMLAYDRFVARPAPR
jgi:dipeptide/tripeptide permease